jgi:HEAT repeat protein
MEANQTAVLIVLIVITIDAVLLASLIILKGIHRRRMLGHEKRRAGYMTLLAHHLTYPDSTEPIGRKTAEDPAFLDAVIDLRNAVAGPEIDTLARIIGRYGMAGAQARRLRSRFPLGRRLRAAVALAEMGDESSAESLMEFLGDREPEVRIQCARGLGRMRWTPAIDAIVDRFNVETPWVRSRFTSTLVGFGPKATWPLIAYIRVNHRFESAGPSAAIRALGVIGDTQAGPPLIEILEEAKDPEIQIAAIEALGAVGGPLALKTLIREFDSDDWRLRAKAATAIGDIGDPLAIPTLAAGLEDTDWWVRRNSAAALTRLPGGQWALYDALASKDRYAQDAAAEALADAGELIAARSREKSGTATARDQALLSHMTPEYSMTGS